MLQDRDEGKVIERIMYATLGWTYYAAMSTVFFPDMLGVKVAPISPMSFFR